jgi:hypothetical protein
MENTKTHTKQEKENGVDSELIKPEAYKHIPGWGIDADPKNNPTYPMKDYNGADHLRLMYKHPKSQPQNMEILKSIERPELSSVFGTATPPRGLSGMLRRYAFTKSEGQASHWMTLILADRVDAVEGIVEDLGHGIIPNIPAEKGWPAKWEHDREGALRQIGTALAITSAIAAFFLVRRSRR